MQKYQHRVLQQERIRKMEMKISFLFPWCYILYMKVIPEAHDKLGSIIHPSLVRHVQS